MVFFWFYFIIFFNHQKLKPSLEKSIGTNDDVAVDAAFESCIALLLLLLNDIISNDDDEL